MSEQSEHKVRWGRSVMVWDIVQVKETSDHMEVDDLVWFLIMLLERVF